MSIYMSIYFNHNFIMSIYMSNITIPLYNIDIVNESDLEIKVDIYMTNGI